MADNIIPIVVISDRVIFNEEKLSQFENFTVEDTKLLFASLLFNLIENFNSDNVSFELLVYLSKEDKQQFSDEAEKLNFQNLKTFFYEKFPDATFLSEKLKNKKQAIILYADVMGVSANSIKEILNLLNSDDNTVVIGISKESSVCFVGSNHINENLNNAINNSQRDYAKLLSLLKAEEYFIHTLNGFLRACNKNSFKDLYDDLSQKKSIEYCSQEMHEKFTHLFVEYKDLLQ
ncbi:hypothetical protein [Ignavibacterium sp.]|uniref:hypothetical protein n=1 Tax=Ignavibacterium sp. TaxID=2651167 RepID=UPI00307EB623